MRIYLSGKMKDKDYHEIFKLSKLKLEAKGHIVLDPSTLPKGLDSNKYMPICNAMIDGADAVVMVGDDWKESRGAMLELQFAKYQGKMIYFDIDDIT